jgi:2'-5' RNA ligase
VGDRPAVSLAANGGERAWIAPFLKERHRMALRLFVAVEIGEQQTKALERIQAGMRHKLPSVRWVKPAAIHLTLAFLGDIDEDAVPRLTALLDEVTRGCAPLDIELKGAGAFPGERNPRVIWIGAGEPTGSLREIARNLKTLLASNGFPTEDRPFTPHLTIGRVRDRGGGEYGRVLPLFREHTAGTMHVCDICLVRSELTPRGSVYTVLHRAPLAGQSHSCFS